MESKLIVCIMGQNCERFIEMCLESVKSAERIIYCDGGSKVKFWNKKKCDHLGLNYNKLWDKVKVIKNNYNQEDKQMNGKQRNFYLKYLKENYPDDWCLCLDADEVVENLDNVKEFIKTANSGLYSVKMRHFIGDLGNEDATKPVHFVPNRLFKISEADSYPEIEHPVLNGHIIGNTYCTTIWHLAYIPNLWEIKKRYDSHLKKSQSHTPEFLRQWYYAHLFGAYPKGKVNILEIPSIILNSFGIDKDELYFEKRKHFEAKHFKDCIDWKNFFNPKDAILWGSGFGQRVKILKDLGVDAIGYELSEYAVKNGHSDYVKDITEKDKRVADLIVAYDLLEHIPYNKLTQAIKNLKLAKKYVLVSIPFIGDPNLEKDPTHIIKETKEWWINKFTKKGLRLIETPKHFLFPEQILIFKTFK